MSAREIKHPEEKLRNAPHGSSGDNKQVHGQLLILQDRSSRQLGLRVSHAQTQGLCRSGLKDRQKGGRRAAAASRHAYVIKSFLLSLHWGNLGLGLGMVTSPGYLLSSRASWNGSKSSGCRQNTGSGGQCGAARGARPQPAQPAIS